MKKIIVKGLMLMCLLVAGSTVSAQEMPQMPPMPVDQAVRTGQLPNGLTYYIRHNETPKGQADFYIAQKVGSVLEEENQRGLAHFLEHMCFNGTKNFPDKGIIEWLESNGVRFGYNLNAYTDVDETVYNISSVPVGSKSVQDSCLLILHDWACDLTLDPKEIDAERGVIHEEWRMRNVGQMRELERLLPVIYPDNRYGHRLPIGTMEVVDNFAPQALVDYYHTWYRPDQQGIIVVGDVDVDYIEGKIKEIFSPIKMPANAKERVYFDVQDTPGTIYAIGADKEIKAPVAELMFKTDKMIPREIRNTQAYYPVKYLTSVIEIMLNQRLADYAANPASEFGSSDVSFGRFMISPTKDALTISVLGKGGDITPAMAAAYRELLRAVRGGFTQGELERANAEIRSQYQKKFDARNNTPSESYSRKYVRAFVDNNPIPGIEMEKQLMDAMTQMIPLQAINQLLPELVTADNRVLLALMPEGEGFITPTEGQLAAALAAVDAENIEPLKDTMKAEPLIPALPAPGKIVSERALEQWDATELTLSNGIKVIVKPTTLKENEIVFDAMAVGGYSVLPASDAANIIFMPMALSRLGMGDYSNSDLTKYLQGKQANIEFEAQAYNRNVSGTSTVADLPTLMELIYALFTEANITADDFAATQEMIAGALANQENTPDYQFGKLIKDALFKAPAAQMLSTEISKQASRDRTVEIIRAMLANPTDYTFVFAGNIDMDTFRPLLEQYVATLPVGKSIALDYAAGAFEPVTGKGQKSAQTAMATPQVWALYYIGAKVPYTIQNKYLTSIAANILSNRLLNKVREEMGATYSIGASGGLSRQSVNNNAGFQIAFPMKPEVRDEVFAAIDVILAEMENEIKPDELKRAKEFYAKEATSAKEENTDWASAISASTLNGIDTFNQAVETINAITAEDVKSFWKSVRQQDQQQMVILNPAD